MFFDDHPDLDAFQERHEASLTHTLIADKTLPPDAPLASRVGGRPFWPAGEPWPTRADGTPLHFLAQVHFADAPRLDPFPTEGLLQFFVDGHDDVYGVNYDNPLAGAYAVVYRPDPTPSDDAGAFPDGAGPIEAAPFTPVTAPCGLAFDRYREYVPMDDVHFEAYMDGFVDALWARDDAIDVEMDFNDAFSAHFVKVGGYGSFVQDDPRRDDDFAVYDTLLFQLPSGSGPEGGSLGPYERQIDWGGGGLAHFFIPADDLADRDFRRTAFHWAC